MDPLERNTITRSSQGRYRPTIVRELMHARRFTGGAAYIPGQVPYGIRGHRPQLFGRSPRKVLQELVEVLVAPVSHGPSQGRDLRRSRHKHFQRECGAASPVKFSHRHAVGSTEQHSQL